VLRALRLTISTPFSAVALLASALHVFAGTIALWLAPPKWRTRIAGSFNVSDYLLIGCSHDDCEDWCCDEHDHRGPC
jgi:hypothetical protein